MDNILVFDVQISKRVMDRLNEMGFGAIHITETDLRTAKDDTIREELKGDHIFVTSDVKFAETLKKYNVCDVIFPNMDELVFDYILGELKKRYEPTTTWKRIVRKAE